MESLSTPSVTPLYIAILGILFLIFTLRAGLYRAKTKISIGTGDDPEMARRIRSQANFIETVPMAIFLLITMEFLGASEVWLHSLCSLLVLGRISHYLGLSELGPFLLRPLGMVSTLIPILLGSTWIFVNVL